MSIKEQITSDLKKALKQKDSIQVDALRFFLSQLKYFQIEKQAEPNEQEIIRLMQKEVKKQKEAIDLFAKAGRQELVDQETKKMSYLTRYLPKPLSDEELQAVIQQVIAQNPEQKQNIGFIIKNVRQKTQGRAEGSQIARLLKTTS